MDCKYYIKNVSTGYIFILQLDLFIFYLLGIIVYFVFLEKL